MEVKSNYAIIMNDNGIMEKISKKKNMNIGQKVFYFEEDVVKSNNVINLKSNSFMKTIGVVAALFLMMFTFFYQLSFQKEAYAVVSLDINPSIQIEVDSNKKIINVKGMNDDGKKLNLEDLKDIDINNGIQKIKLKLEDNNYLKNNKDVLIAFALVNKNEDKNYEDTVISAIKSTFDSQKLTYVKAKKEDVEEAKTKGISLGRYEATQIADNTVKNKLDKAPVKEITELIKNKQNVIQWGVDKNNETIKIPAKVVDKEMINKNNTINNNSSHSKDDLGLPEKVTDDSKNTQENISNNKNSNNEKSEDDVLEVKPNDKLNDKIDTCLLYTSPSPRDLSTSRMPSSA
eukprot:TRINITY_DN67_c0_g1_i20.p1 TRINITY_DN67_c0_g1~~TRINITY_DN67_c0_g1_i20.p1  ORF type:complete len:345 (+),score=82.53 TRINITY_DN67_c0_g1_i20:848-1882(+)